MTAKIINLRAVKKATVKTAARAQADANAAKFGRSKAEKTAEAARKDKAKRLLDGHAQDPKP